MNAKEAGFRATGRRKTSIAIVRLAAGNGKIRVNGRPVDKYFNRDFTVIFR